MTTATSIGVTHPNEQMLYTRFVEKLNFPKSFGSFFANSYIKHTENLYYDYRKVCAQNNWKHTRFRYYNTMVRWLMSNNAPRETIEGVLDMALIHCDVLRQHLCDTEYYGLDDTIFLDAYSTSKYSGFRDEEFDYTKVPRSNSKKEYDSF